MTEVIAPSASAAKAAGSPDASIERVRLALAGTTLEPPRPLTDLNWPLSLDRMLGPRWQRTLRPAAVLVGLVPRESGARVILTERSADLRDHAGQVSFPGGAVDDDDDSLLAAAQREAHEEIGVPPDHIDYIGALPDYPTVTRFCITPVVAHVRPPAAGYQVEAGEVAAVFEVPLARVLDLQTYRTGSVGRLGVSVPYYEFRHERWRVWGATAGMLHALASAVQAHESGA